ncbi:hypothetical protein ACGF12_34445 [Kitasatospora sp. NPDC048296]|uniref:hypothetical protein n=1 Tax=Kitasatospora sp. NPDC048296 TaxID=3364048 RepID=UPI003721DD6F
MIPGPHRLKGGALLLRAEEPGLPGPFGSWPQDDQEPAEPEPAGQGEPELRC